MMTASYRLSLWMGGLMTCWATFNDLCSDFLSLVVELLYQSEMQVVMMCLWCVIKVHQHLSEEVF